jgi:uncharacterized membrane protein YeaQ/YmgE (transglycosylase-associated protein family)
MSILWVLIIGALAGWIAGMLWKGGGFGLLGDIIVGIVGACIGGWLFGMLGIFTFGLIATLIEAVIGAIILLWLVRLIKKA